MISQMKSLDVMVRGLQIALDFDVWVPEHRWIELANEAEQTERPA